MVFIKRQSVKTTDKNATKVSHLQHRTTTGINSICFMLFHFIASLVRPVFFSLFSPSVQVSVYGFFAKEN